MSYGHSGGYGGYNGSGGGWGGQLWNRYVAPKPKNSSFDQRKHSIKAISEWELYSFDDLIENNPKMREVMARGLKETKIFRNLAMDIYSSLWKPNPLINDGDMYKPFAVSRQIVSELMEIEEYHQLRRYTKSNKPRASQAAVKMAEKAIELLTEEQKQQINDAFDEMSKALAKGKGQGQGGNDELDGENNYDSQAEDQIFDDLEKSKLGLSQSDIEKLGDQLAKAFKGELDKEIEDLKTENDAMITFGRDPADLSPTTYEEKEKIMQFIKKSRMLQEVAKITGRMKELARSIRATRKTNSPEEVVDMKRGNDISKILSTELMLLDDEDTEILFLKNFVEQQLLQYKLEGKDDMGRGPVVMLIDCSGSMQGQREIWAKGVMLALQMIAKTDNRDMYIAYFNGNIRNVFQLKHGKVEDITKWMTFVALGADGGTDFEQPLGHALKMIESSKTFKRADLIMISDGECHVSAPFLANFLKKKENLDFKAIGVLIGGTSQVMRSFCDLTISLSDLTNPAAAEKAIFSIGLPQS